MSVDHPIAEVVEKLEDATHTPDMTLGDVLEEFGAAAYSSTLLSIAILLVSPLSGVPVFSSLCGLSIFLIAIQGALGKQTIWLPSRLTRLSMSSQRAEKTIARARAAALWLDQRSAQRLLMLVTPPFSRVLYAICAIVGLCLPVMEFIPMTSSMVGLSVCLITTGLLARDGLISAVGLLILPIIGFLVVTAVSVVLSI